MGGEGSAQQDFLNPLPQTAVINTTTYILRICLACVWCTQMKQLDTISRDFQYYCHYLQADHLSMDELELHIS